MRITHDLIKVFLLVAIVAGWWVGKLSQEAAVGIGLILLIFL